MKTHAMKLPAHVFFVADVNVREGLKLRSYGVSTTPLCNFTWSTWPELNNAEALEMLWLKVYPASCLITDWRGSGL